jgi:D-ribulokinase
MPVSGPYAIGLDLGTSGCRAVAVDRSGAKLATARVGLSEPSTPQPGWVEQDPDVWWAAAVEVLRQLAGALPGREAGAICVDATSGTLLLAAPDGTPRGPALMYNDRRAVAESVMIDAVATSDSPACGPTSSLAKLLYLARAGRAAGLSLAMHQADWIASRLCGGYCGWSDWNNALKLGYDAQCLAWPDWVRLLVPETILLPQVGAPGRPIRRLNPALAAEVGLSPRTQVVAGTTDSTAAAIASGVSRPGDAVTSLGSTLVLKVVSERPLASRAHGVYSHRFGDLWLVGGASNTGGAVLRQYFGVEEVVALSARIDPEIPSGLDYYPLPSMGERFPRQDPGLAPKLDPRPTDRQRFLQGILEGIASIEAEGYRLLAALGAPPPTRVIGTGGGASNPVWSRLRERALGVPVLVASEQEAAYGAARLALPPASSVDRSAL